MRSTTETVGGKDYKVLVIGGGGYLGKLLVRRLLENGYNNVRIFDCIVPHSFSLLNDKRVEFVQGDLADNACIQNACKGIRRVFHLATPSYLVTNKELLEKVNVGGTKAIINACIQQNVSELVYCSSASVVFGSKPVVLGHENLPYVQDGEADTYNVSKAKAEKLVLAAHNERLAGGGALQTIALRPHSIFGYNHEGQCGIVDPMLDAIKNGKNKIIIGDGKNLSDFTHVENVVHAHILAGELLGGDKQAITEGKGNGQATDCAIGGQAYNITNEQPIQFWKFLSDLCYECGFSRPYIYLPYVLLLIVAYILEFIMGKNITFTVQKVRLLGLHHYYSAEKAKKILGYSPVVKYREGFQQTVEYLCRADLVVQQKLSERTENEKERKIK